MRLHAVALGTLLLLAPLPLALPEPQPLSEPPPASSAAGGPLGASAAGGPLDARERPPPSARYDATYLLNDTRVRAPSFPGVASHGCLLIESWGGSTILSGGVTVHWRPEGFGGAEILKLTVLLPGRDPVETMGASPLEVRLDGAALSAEVPAKLILRAAEDALPIVRQQANVRLAWDMVGGPIAATAEGCETD